MALPSFDVSRFTLAELEAVEGVVGVPLDKFTAAPSRALLIAALVWVQRRRDDPTTSLEDVKSMTLGEMTRELGVADDGPPDDGGDGVEAEPVTGPPGT